MDKPEATLLLWLLRDIKALWDKEGLGDDHDVSEPLYARLQAGIEALEAQHG